MKIKLAILLVLLCLKTPLLANNGSNIISAFKACDAKKVASFFTNSVEFSVLGKDDIYSRVQAELILKSFFTKNPCTSFEILHSGSAKVDSKYYIGVLTTNSSTFRIYFVTKNDLIQEISIQEE